MIEMIWADEDDFCDFWIGDFCIEVSDEIFDEEMMWDDGAFGAISNLQFAISNWGPSCAQARDDENCNDEDYSFGHGRDEVPPHSMTVKPWRGVGFSS